MKIRCYKPFSPEQLSSLGLPNDPTDARITALPTGRLQGLLNRVYEQLDSDYPPLEAVDWYHALSDVLKQRAHRIGDDAALWGRNAAVTGTREGP